MTGVLRLRAVPQFLVAEKEKKALKNDGKSKII